MFINRKNYLSLKAENLVLQKQLDSLQAEMQQVYVILRLTENKVGR